MYEENIPQEQDIIEPEEYKVDENQNEEDQPHKCSMCGIVKILFVFNRYTQLCSDCYSKESTRLANEYYESLREQEALRLNIRGMINEQNHNKRRVES